MRLKFQKIKQYTCFSLSLLIAMCILFLSPMSVNAAGKKATANGNYKKAPQIKCGTYNVGFSTNSSYLKFVASKDGVYTFKVYDIQTDSTEKPDYNRGNFSVNIYKNNKMKPQTLKVKEGKADALFVATKECYNKYYKNAKDSVYRHMTNRTGKIKLEKGQLVYLEYFYTGSKGSYSLDIKIN